MNNDKNDEIFETEKLNLWNFQFPKALSREKNEELILQYRQTQDKAKQQKLRDQIVYGNMPLAISFFKRRYFSFDEQARDDILQEAALAIAKAVDLFDFEKDVAFSTYLCNAFKNILHAQLKLDKRSDKVLGLSQKNPSKKSEENFSVEDTIEERYFDHSWVLDKVEVDNLMQTILPKFSEIEQDIFKDFFLEDKTQKEIAKKYDVTRQYIAKITKKMLGDIRKAYESGRTDVFKRYSNSFVCQRQQKENHKKNDDKIK